MLPHLHHTISPLAAKLTTLVAATTIAESVTQALPDALSAIGQLGVLGAAVVVAWKLTTDAQGRANEARDAAVARWREIAEEANEARDAAVARWREIAEEADADRDAEVARWREIAEQADADRDAALAQLETTRTALQEAREQLWRRQEPQ